MVRLKIRNWDKWQSYRKGRGQPSWIKIHRRLMRDPNWVALTDAQRGQLVAIWLLAADQWGEIPDSVEIIQKLCYMESAPDLQLFINKGFIETGDQVAAKWQSTGCHLAANVATQNRIEENRKEKKEPGAGAPFAFVGRVISLKQGDYDQWEMTFPNVNLRPYLEARDIFLSEMPEDDNRRKKWMMSTAADLRNKNTPAAIAKFIAQGPAGRSKEPPGEGRLRKVFEPEPPKIPFSEEELARRAEQVKKHLKTKQMPLGREKH